MSFFGSTMNKPNFEIGFNEGLPGAAFSSAKVYACSCLEYFATLSSLTLDVLKSTIP